MPSALALGVHAFYYLWYGTPEADGKWVHWDHSTLPHWTEAVRRQYPDARFIPPHDIHAPFYPEAGPYSSRDPATLARYGRLTRLMNRWDAFLLKGDDGEGA